MTQSLDHSLLTDPIIYTRFFKKKTPIALDLPALLTALAQDEIHDFPALRPHQRHPWHAFLVHIAALALIHTEAATLQKMTPSDWRQALLALTPDDSDGAAWCLITPPERPALLQAPLSDPAAITDWSTEMTPDRIDLLVTAKNHDLKARRIQQSRLDDWLFALLSLQTQQGVLGAGYYGISRMNGGLGSRPALGIVPVGGWGRRWHRDVKLLLAHRDTIAQNMELPTKGGIALVWLQPWNGSDYLPFTALDPFYIEICRQIRLMRTDSGQIVARTKTSSKRRINADLRKGVTGDAWIPIQITAKAKKDPELKALTITNRGFDYKLMVKLLFKPDQFKATLAQQCVNDDDEQGLRMLAQGITRGQGKTEGYHERWIPVSKTMRKLLRQAKTDVLAQIAEERIVAIDQINTILWTALVTFFDQSTAQANNTQASNKFSDSAKNKAKVFIQQFERIEDQRFFEGTWSLNAECDAADPTTIRGEWLSDMAQRAEQILQTAFQAGPRCSERYYQAQATAYNRFRASLSDPKKVPILLTDIIRQRTSHTNAIASNQVTPSHSKETSLAVAKPVTSVSKKQSLSAIKQTSFDF
jgi:CRISPR system Cascade subunit CasA